MKNLRKFLFAAALFFCATALFTQTAGAGSDGEDEQILTAGEIGELDWRDFKGHWEINLRLETIEGTDGGETEEFDIENEDDFASFISGLEGVESEFSGGIEDELDSAQVRMLGGSVSITGDRDGFRYTEGSVTRLLVVLIRMFDDEFRCSIEFSAKKMSD